MSVSGSRRHRYTSPFTGPLGPSLRSYSFRPKEYYTLKCTPLEIEFEKAKKYIICNVYIYIHIHIYTFYQFSFRKSFSTKCFNVQNGLYQSNKLA